MLGDAVGDDERLVPHTFGLADAFDLRVQPHVRIAALKPPGTERVDLLIEARAHPRHLVLRQPRHTHLRDQPVDLPGADAVDAISPQKPDGSLSTREQAELTYDVLSDPGNQIATALGVLFTPSDDALAAQRQLGLDTAAVNADGTAGLPMPTVAVVDRTGTIAWIDVQPNYTGRTEPAAILEAVARLT